jgi:glycosyltransferase involved in cell wall biosynthesis
VKLACVVQRYGAGIAGGSEAHCREIAERLALRHDVTVLTTTATDYVTWANDLPAGESRERGVRVLRFRVARQRRLGRFAELSDLVLDSGAPADADLQTEWFRANGPDAPELLEYLRDHGTTFDLVLFWTFRYAPSFFGLPIVSERAVLVPTAEEESAIDLTVLPDLLSKPAGYLFLTPEEQRLVSSRAGRVLEPSAVIGIGMEPMTAIPDRTALDALGVPDRFVLYLGRVDRNKGCRTLLEYFQEFVADQGATAPPLVLAGPLKMRIPEHPRIRALGYVSEEIRHALLSHASVLVVPSRYESLSIALLEGWNYRLPALVNARCAVLQGQVRRANGGLFYRNVRQFVEGLRYLLIHEDERRVFGAQGQAYVDREYRWPVVMERVERLLETVRLRGAQRDETSIDPARTRAETSF